MFPSPYWDQCWCLLSPRLCNELCLVASPQRYLTLVIKVRLGSRDLGIPAVTFFINSRHIPPESTSLILRFFFDLAAASMKCIWHHPYLWSWISNHRQHLTTPCYLYIDDISLNSSSAPTFDFWSSPPQYQLLCNTMRFVSDLIHFFFPSQVQHLLLK